MGKTPIYGLGYLEPNQDLSENLDLDELRFRAIDTQTYSLYQIFGNGIIEDETNNYASWVISVIPNDFQNIRVSSGKGFVSWKSAETTAYVDVALPILPTGVTSVTVWAYAIANDNTPVTKEVDFITSLFQIDDPDNYISLGGVIITFGATTTIVPFTTGRTRISLFASLSNIINQHKHIGGSNNPSPINLGSHVQGKLSGEYVENLDISTVTKGTLDAERLPTIDHKNLTNIGTLTHSQIDSLLGALTLPDSSYRLSDLSMANRLQIVLTMKKQFAEDSDSSQINSLFYIPAIYPNRSTDTTVTFRDLDLPVYVTEANVYDTVGSGYDPAVNFIEAAASDSNTAFSVTYDTKTHFQTMYDYITGKDLGLYADENVKINGTSADSVDGNFTIDTPLNFSILSNAAGPDFENAAYGWNYFTKKLRNTDDTYTDNQYTVFTIPTAKRDWSDVTHIGLGINLSETDSACSIYMTLLVDTADNRIKDTTLVSETIEDRANATVQTLEIKRSIFKKIFTNGTDSYDTDIFVNVDLSELIELPSNRVNIVGFAFYITTNDATGEKWDGNASPVLKLVAPSSELIVDANGDELTNVIAERQDQENGYLSAMFLWNEYLYASSARYIFRLNTGSSSATLNLYAYKVTVPTNTSYTISARITDSSTENDLNSKTALDITAEATLSGDTYEIVPPSSYTITVPGAGDVTEPKFNIGRYVDIIIDLYSDFEGVNTPEFQKLNIVYTSVGGTQSRIWNKDHDDFENEQSGWLESEYQRYNIAIGATYTDGGLDKNSLILENVSDIGNWIYIQKNAVISANQSATTSTYEDGQDNSNAEFNLKEYLTPWQIFNKSTTYGFYKPKDFRILWDNTSVYADTANDRIIHFESNGNVKRIIQGNLRLKKSERDFMVLAAHYNPDTGVIYLPFSQCVNIVDITSIIVVYDGFDIAANETQYVSSVELLTPLVSQKSSTVLLKLTTKFNKVLKDAATKKVIILSGAFTSNGQADNASETSNGTNNISGSGSNTGNSVLTPPSQSGSGDSKGDGSGGFVVQSTQSSVNALLNSPSLRYFDLRNRINFNGTVEITDNVNLASQKSSFKKMDFKAFADGDITEIFDYNGDGISTTLIGPPRTGLTTAQSGSIELSISQGPIYYANIYNPISINMTISYQYVIAQPFVNSVACFDSDTASTLLWTISSSLVSYIEGSLGSAFVLSNNNVLCAVPSKSSTDKGQVIIIKRTNSKDFPITTLPQDGDCVYALPSEKSGEYYVIVDDIYTSGKNSKLLRVNSSNKVIKSWNNNNLLLHPKGLAVLQNGDLLVSE
jgi:hypothetical protein